MYRLAALAALALVVLATGCFNETGSTNSNGVATPEVSGPHVDWIIRYPVGAVSINRDQLSHHCPSGSTCDAVQVRTVTDSRGRHPWAIVATRRVECPVGEPPTPPDCAAIATLRTTLAKRRGGCLCPAVILPPGSATASIRGHRVVVPLDFCTYCGKGPKALAALRSIMRSG